MNTRHCERSEAIQDIKQILWPIRPKSKKVLDHHVASLLVMTVKIGVWGLLFFRYFVL